MNRPQLNSHRNNYKCHFNKTIYEIKNESLFVVHIRQMSLKSSKLYHNKYDFNSLKVFLNPLCQKFGKNLPIAVCDGKIINYRRIKVPVISVRYFCLMKDDLCAFLWVTRKKPNVHLLHSFIHVFIIHNSITKY